MKQTTRTILTELPAIVDGAEIVVELSPSVYPTKAIAAAQEGLPASVSLQRIDAYSNRYRIQPASFAPVFLAALLSESVAMLD